MGWKKDLLRGAGVLTGAAVIAEAARPRETRVIVRDRPIPRTIVLTTPGRFRVRLAEGRSAFSEMWEVVDGDYNEVVLQCYTRSMAVAEANGRNRLGW